VQNATASKLEFGLYTSRLEMHDLTKLEAKHKCMNHCNVLTNKEEDPSSAAQKGSIRLA
jgi:hypothetical protein